MSETVSSAPDLDYAKQLRVGWVHAEDDVVQQLRTPLNTSKLKDSGGELTDGVRTELDSIIQAVGSVSEHAHKLPGFTAQHQDAIKNGYVLAGENVTGAEGGTKMRFASHEEFRAMVARAVGEEALAAYELALGIGSAKEQEIAQGGDEDTIDTSVISAVHLREESRATEGDSDQASAEEPEVNLAAEADQAKHVSANSLEEHVSEVEVREGETQVEPTFADALSSPESLVRALDDQELDAGVRNDVRKVVSAWQHLKAAKLAEEVWTELIVPQLEKLTGPIPEMSKKTRDATHQLEELTQGLNQLATAVEYGDFQRMGDLGRQYRFAEQYATILDSLKPVFIDNDLTATANRFAGEKFDADDRLQRVRRASAAGFSPDDAVELLNNIDVSAAATAQDIQQQIEEQDTGGALMKLSRRQETIDGVIQFARMAGNTDLSSAYQTARGVIMNEVEELFSRGSRMDSSSVMMLRAHIESTILQPLRDADQFLRLAAMYKQEATR